MHVLIRLESVRAEGSSLPPRRIHKHLATMFANIRIQVTVCIRWMLPTEIWFENTRLSLPSVKPEDSIPGKVFQAQN